MVAKTILLRIPTMMPISVQVQRRRRISIAQAAATLCRPTIRICRKRKKNNEYVIC